MKRLVSYPARSATRRRGGVLVAALMAVLAVGVGCAVFLQLSSTLSRRQAHSNDVKRAFYLAEAGLAEAYTGLAEARTGNVGTPEEPALYGGGLLWVEAEEADGLVQLESTALCGEGRATLGMAVRRVEQSLAMLGIFADGDVTLAGEGLVDGYDSRAGSYDEQKAKGTNAGLGLLGTNGSVTLAGADASVDGDVRCGAGETVSAPSAGSITGSIEPRLEAAVLPEVRLPEMSVGAGIEHADAVPLLIPPGSSALEFLRVRESSDAILLGPSTLLIGTLEVEAGSSLSFDTSGGPVQLFIEERIDLAAGSLLTCSSESTDEVLIQVAADGGSVTPNAVLDAQGSLFGTVYAPLSTVRISNDLELFGFVVAEGLQLEEGARLHFDRALVATQGLLMPRTVSWRVVDIPDGLASAGGDPFRLLGVDRDSLSSPALAHEDQWLLITYEDLAAVEQTYEGWESGFDWADVQSVLAGARDGDGFAGVAVPEPPPPPPPPPSPAMDAILDPNLDSGELKSLLKDMSPLTDAEMVAAIERSPAMETGHLKDVLDDNSPGLSDEVLLTSINNSPLDSSDLKHVLDKNSPGLSDAVMVASITGGLMNSSDLKHVLTKNSPGLSPGVLQAAIDRIPPMNGGDLSSVLSAQ